MAKNILAWSEAARQFYREIGKKPNGKAIRFYLGDDEKKATANVLRLEALWDGVETRWSELASVNVADSAFPCWDEVTVALGRAIAEGEWSITLDPPKVDTDGIAVWLASLRTHFPMILVQIPGPSKAEEGNQAFALAGAAIAEQEEARHRAEMREIKQIVTPFGRKVATRETLHDALDAYKEWIERTFVDVEGRTTQTGKKQGERAARIKRYAKDMPLSDLGTHELEAVIEFWRTRPEKPARKSKSREPYSFTLRKQTIRLFKHFVRWLHREKTFPWNKPVDLDLDRIKIVPDAETKYEVETGQAVGDVEGHLHAAR